jgi:glucan phosphoethanolaminetransferase (alkaline phosphatase superfamily)
VAKLKKQDIYFYVAVGVLIALVGLSVWYRANRQSLEQPAQRTIQAVQIAMIVILVVLFLLSFRQPLRSMNKTLFQERRELARKKRRKKHPKRR